MIQLLCFTQLLYHGKHNNNWLREKKNYQCIKPANEEGSNRAAALPSVQAEAAAAIDIDIVSTVGDILSNDTDPAKHTQMHTCMTYIHIYMYFTHDSG